MIDSKNLKVTLNYLALIINISLIGYFFFFNTFVYFINKDLLIILIIISLIIPSITYYLDNKDYSYLPLGEIILIFFLIAYLSIYLFDQNYVVRSYTWMLNDLSEEETKVFYELFYNNFSYFKYFYFSIISFYIGFLVMKKVKNFNGLISDNFEKYFRFSENDLFIIGSFFLFIKLIFFLFPEINNLILVGNFKSIIFLFYISCHWTYFLSVKKNYLKKIFIIISFIVFFFIDIVETGSQIGITLMLISIVLIFWLIKRKIFFFGIFLILFNFYFFQDIKIEYRESIKNIREGLRLPIFKITNYKDSILNNIKLIAKNDLENKNNVSNVRLTISSYAYHKVLDLKSKNQLELKEGRTYQNLIFFPIPRFLWEKKPVASYGIEFGLITKIGRIKSPTSINLSWITEAFWNFGNLFFIPMIIKGLFIGFLSKIIIYKRNSIISIAWVASIIHLVIPETNFAIMSVSLIYQFIFLMIFLTIYKFFFKK